MWGGKNSFFQLSQPRAELAMVSPPNHSTDRHLAIPTCELCSHTQARSIDCRPVHLFIQPSLCLAPAQLGPSLQGFRERLSWKNDTEHQSWHTTSTNEDGRGISESTNNFPFMQQTFGQGFLLPKGRSFDGCMRNAGCLAHKIQPKELQRCTWGLEAMAVPIHTQSKSRDKYESEKEKLWNFIQVLSTFTHAEKLYWSKPSHWLHMWARIAHMKKGHWIWSLLYAYCDIKPILTKSKTC